MASVIYPTALPNPGGSSETSAERRRISDLPGGRKQFAGLQTDYLATQTLTWFLSDAESFIFHDWWKVTLIYGGAWFSATWPSPTGWVDVVRRFMKDPTWTNQGNGYWSVTAEMQVRGRGLVPQA